MHSSYEVVNNELELTKKILAEKEIENRELKKKVWQWKKKALENESLYNAAIQQQQAQEQRLMTQYTAQMDALVAAHVEKMESVSRTILEIQHSTNSNHHDHHDYNQSFACNASTSIEIADKASATKEKQQKASDLMFNINEMMVAIESKIGGYLDDIAMDYSDTASDSVSSDEDQYDDDENQKDWHEKYLPESLSPSCREDSSDAPAVSLSRPASLSSPAFLSTCHLYQPSHDDLLSRRERQPTNPQLRPKPTMENLTRVIPNFLLKKASKEQWKITNRHSFIKNSS